MGMKATEQRVVGGTDRNERPVWILDVVEMIAKRVGIDVMSLRTAVNSWSHSIMSVCSILNVILSALYYPYASSLWQLLYASSSMPGLSPLYGPRTTSRIHSLVSPSSIPALLLSYF